MSVATSTSQARSQSRFVEATRAAGARALTVGVVASVLIGLVVGLLLLIAVGVLAGLLAAVVLMALGSALWAFYVRSSMQRVAGIVLDRAAVESPAGEHVSFRNALDGVAILTGVRVPSLRVLQTDSANAMVVQGLDEDSTVVVTTGLLEGARVVESEVLAAELLCRVRDGSARYLTMAAGLPPLVRTAAGITVDSVGAILGDQRAVLGDQEAVSVTRYPPALVAALERMQRAGTEVPSANPETAALWIAPALGSNRGVPEVIDRSVNQDLSYRIAVLQEL